MSVNDNLGQRMKSYYENTYRFGMTRRMPVAIRIDGNVLTVVSRDGLTSKKYTIVSATELFTGFYNGENGPEIKSLEDVKNVCFTAYIDKSSAYAGTTPVVILAVYSGDEFVDCVIAEGQSYAGEITKYKAVYDISEYTADDNLEIHGFVWDGFETLKPLTEASVIK